MGLPATRRSPFSSSHRPALGDVSSFPLDWFSPNPCRICPSFHSAPPHLLRQSLAAGVQMLPPRERKRERGKKRCSGSRKGGLAWRFDVAKDWPPSSPFERQKEKRNEREREEIWREKEEELVGPPNFSFPLSSFSLHSLRLAHPSFSSLASLGYREKVEGQR